MVFKCRLCGKDCGAAQGRGAHESHCAQEKGAKIVGTGPDRHFITADGKQVAAPNSKYSKYTGQTVQLSKPKLKIKLNMKPRNNIGAGTMRQRAEEKALQLAALVGNEPMLVKEIAPIYCRLVGRKKVSSTSVSGFLRMHPQTFQRVGFGQYQVVNGTPQARNGKAEKKDTALARADHPSAILVEEPKLTPEQQYAVNADVSHRAVESLQKSAALLQFSVLMEEIGPPQALAMVAGMSKLGKALNRR